MEQAVAKPALYVFEGGECCGKTTVINTLKQRLTMEGYTVTTLREPGGSNNAERIRTTIMDCEGICAMSEALLFAAARAEFTEKTLRPLLNSGDSKSVILLDRYYFSSLAYQGIVKGLDTKTVYNMNLPFVHGICPTAWFLLDVSPSVAAQRMSKRGENNRLDKFGMLNAQGLRLAYRSIARDFGGTVIDANQNIDKVVESCYQEIVSRIPFVGQVNNMCVETPPYTETLKKAALDRISLAQSAVDELKEKCAIEERRLATEIADFGVVSTCTEEQRALAEFLHKSLCNKNHMNECDWEFSNIWSGFAHIEYLKLAKAILELSSSGTVKKLFSFSPPLH